MVMVMFHCGYGKGNERGKRLCMFIGILKVLKEESRFGAIPIRRGFNDEVSMLVFSIGKMRHVGNRRRFD